MLGEAPQQTQESQRQSAMLWGRWDRVQDWRGQRTKLGFIEMSRSSFLKMKAWAVGEESTVAGRRLGRRFGWS